MTYRGSMAHVRRLQALGYDAEHFLYSPDRSGHGVVVDGTLYRNATDLKLLELCQRRLWQPFLDALHRSDTHE